MSDNSELRIVRMSSFTHVNPDSQFTFKAKKGRVAVFLLLGEENKDGSDPLDLEARINEFGWFCATLAPEQEK